MRILFITYYYPPCNSIASNRTVSFCNSLIKAGHEVTVVTRGWKGSENNWNDYIGDSPNDVVVEKIDANKTVYYLPYSKLISKSGKLKTMISFVKGKFNPEINADSFFGFVNYLLSKEKFEYLLISSPPINIVRLGFNIKSLYPNLKLIVDFRDLQNHIVLATNPIPTFAQRVEHYFIRRYLKIWLKQASHILVASELFGEFLLELGLDSKRLLNGFEEELLNWNDKNKTNRFDISVLGTIYPNQETSFFISVLKGFVKDKSPEKIRINLIGINTIKSVADLFSKELSAFCFITDKLPREEAIKIGKESCVLAYPGWKGYKGMYSGKIFEYLALKRHIFIAPSDNDVISNLVDKCRAGSCVNSIEEGISYLNDLYYKWENNGLKLESDISKVIEFSRENQNTILTELI